MGKFLSLLALDDTSTNIGSLQSLSLQQDCPTLVVTWPRMGHRSMADHSCSFPPAPEAQLRWREKR